MKNQNIMISRLAEAEVKVSGELALVSLEAIKIHAKHLRYKARFAITQDLTKLYRDRANILDDRAKELEQILDHILKEEKSDAAHI